MYVGPTGGGKTTVYEILKEALICLHKAGHKHYYYQPVHTHLCPQSKGGLGEREGGREGHSREHNEAIV